MHGCNQQRSFYQAEPVHEMLHSTMVPSHLVRIASSAMPPTTRLSDELLRVGTTPPPWHNTSSLAYIYIYIYIHIIYIYIYIIYIIYIQVIIIIYIILYIYIHIIYIYDYIYIYYIYIYIIIYIYIYIYTGNYNYIYNIYIIYIYILYILPNSCVVVCVVVHTYVCIVFNSTCIETVL